MHSKLDALIKDVRDVLRVVGELVKTWAGNKRMVLATLAGAAVVALAAATLFVATLGHSSSSEAETNGKGGTKPPETQVRITPVNGSTRSRPDRGVTVTASNGHLNQVSVLAGGRPVPGGFTADHTGWKTKWTLTPGRAYTVTASAVSPKGKVVSATSRFRTTRGRQPVSVSDITPQPGETVGVGMPIIVTFNQPVYNKSNVEKMLFVKSDHNDTGRWSWISPYQVVYRTKAYWKPHQKVSFTGHLAGVRAAKGAYLTSDVSRSFQIGVSNITVANSKTHYMRVDHDGVVKKFPISTGNASTKEYTTTSGIHLTKEKSPTVTMESPHRKKGDPGYYKEKVNLAVRISDAGEYVHQSVGEYYFLGKQNASHGCVRTSPEGARYFYDISQRGDIVDVTGTNRPLADEPGNGWTFWTRSWQSWVQGSAL